MAKIKSGLEQQMFALVNKERIKHNLLPLDFSNKICVTARKHSLEQLRSNEIYHDSPYTGSIDDRLKKDHIEFITCGENVAMGSPMSALHKGLMQSKEHRANILHTDFNQIGIGIYQSSRRVLFITQVFTKSVPIISRDTFIHQLSTNITKWRYQKGLQPIKMYSLNLLNYLNLQLASGIQLTQKQYDDNLVKMIHQLRKMGIPASNIQLSYQQHYDAKEILDYAKLQLLSKSSLKAVCIAVHPDQHSPYLWVSIAFAS